MEISYIVPMYNVAAYIQCCLESLYNQELNYSDFEVIIVNDGSTDDSLSIAREFAKDKPNCIVIDQANKGVSGARNTAIKRAKGTYMTFVDADDFLFPSVIRPCLELLEKNQLDFIKGEYLQVDLKGNILPTITNKKKKRQPYDGKVLNKAGFYNAIFQNEFFSCIFIYKRSFWEENHFHFSEEVMFCEDVHFMFNQMIKAEARAMYTSRVLYAYRINPVSIVGSINTKKLIDYIWVLSNIRLNRDEYPEVRETIDCAISVAVCMIADWAGRLSLEDCKLVSAKLKESPLATIPLRGTPRQKLQVLVYNLFSVQGFVVLKRLKDRLHKDVCEFLLK